MSAGCGRCKTPASDTGERCSHSPKTSPRILLRKFKNKSNSYELFSSEMGSNRTGEVNCKIYPEDGDTFIKNKLNPENSPSERNGNGSLLQKPRGNSQTPEYVKRTAKLFETIKITEDVETKNGVTRRSEFSQSSVTEMKKPEGGPKISLDSLDGEFNKKPSYLGVSCSNSGYRNVINYDSKLREGFWTANSQRESLVLTSSRLRESSPMRRDFEFKTHNGTDGDSGKVIRQIPIEKEESVPVNGVGKPEKFVNISTSTKTISTFRNSKDMKEGVELENGVNGLRDYDRKSNSETKVNLKQILNSKNDDTYRKGYSSLGFSPKILKSPEKNCNSFLKSISSFENNCKKSQGMKSSVHSKTEKTIGDSKNSIQQRIERLYGPGALAQSFYMQKTNSKSKLFENLEDGDVAPRKPQVTVIPITMPNGNSTSPSLPKATVLESVPTEPCSNGHTVEPPGPEVSESERNGHYFLKLLRKETDRLERLASFAESELENGENLPEDVSGKLRAAAGKARLLVCQKLHQFEGLCHKNLNEKPGEQFPTTSEDLAGFWDMVMLQIVQVYGVFDELEELKKNNWKGTTTKKESPGAVTNGQSPPTKITPKKSTNSPASEKQSQKSEAAKKAREETRRKLLEERRKKMKELKENKIVNNDNEVEIFAK